jgi:hypothetical protein
MKELSHYIIAAYLAAAAKKKANKNIGRIELGHEERDYHL